MPIVINPLNGSMGRYAWQLVGDNFIPFLPYTAIGSVDAESTNSIPTEPIEGGKLAAFNNIAQPDRVNVSVYFDGDYAIQAAALALLRAKQDSGALCMLISPSEIWRNMAIEHYDYSRAQSAGASFLEVRISLVQVTNVEIQQQSYSPKKATSSNMVNTGQTQETSLAKGLADSASSLYKKMPFKL